MWLILKQSSTINSVKIKSKIVILNTRQKHNKTRLKVFSRSSRSGCLGLVLVFWSAPVTDTIQLIYSSVLSEVKFCIWHNTVFTLLVRFLLFIDCTVLWPLLSCPVVLFACVLKSCSSFLHCHPICTCVAFCCCAMLLEVHCSASLCTVSTCLDIYFTAELPFRKYQSGCLGERPDSKFNVVTFNLANFST